MPIDDRLSPDLLCTLLRRSHANKDNLDPRVLTDVSRIAADIIVTDNYYKSQLKNDEITEVVKSVCNNLTTTWKTLPLINPDKVFKQYMSCIKSAIKTIIMYKLWIDRPFDYDVSSMYPAHIAIMPGAGCIIAP